MTAFRAIPLHVHGALEVIAAPILFVAPFALGFSAPAGAVSIIAGVLLLGLALSIYGDPQRGSLPLTAHAGFDYALALTRRTQRAAARSRPSDHTSLYSVSRSTGTRPASRIHCTSSSRRTRCGVVAPASW